MPGLEEHLLGPLTQGWLGKIDQAVKHKRRHFGNVADQCMAFYSGLVDSFYNPRFQQQFINGGFSPKFKVHLNKAFELVALFGPLIYNRNPTRECIPPAPIEYGPEVFGDAADPQVQAFHQHCVDQDRQRRSVLKSGCQALEAYLNYTPGEQPNGGLKQASEDACTEALVKGRGILWTEAYMMPGVDRVLTGSFYDSVDRFISDPDAETIGLGETYWISRLCIEPHWKAERDRGQPFGTFRNKNGIESAEAKGAGQGNRNWKREHELGNTFDLFRYWKIWSIGGVGTRLTGTAQPLQNAFDDVVGDYAYIEVARGVPYPLNMPYDRFKNGADGNGVTDDEVRSAFAWPVPYWKDGRWPCAILDFYRQPNCSWPISPLRPGLGELVALNIIMSRLTFHIYQNTRTLIAVLESAKASVQEALQSSDDEKVFGIPQILKDIDQIIKFIQGPAVNYDVWKIIEHLFLLFDKRVGLTELMYSLNPGAASRTSEDAQTKQQMLQIRPDYMADKVGAWQVEAARNEKLCAYYSGVGGQSVEPAIGPTGAWIFEKAFTNAGEETVLREMTCTITAGSQRKRNREKQAADLKEVYQAQSQQLGQYMTATGDTNPMNALNEKLFDAMGLTDMQDVKMGPMAPPQPPPEAQADPAQEIALQHQQQEMAIQAEKHNQSMAISAAEHQQHAAEQSQAHGMDLMGKLAKLRLERMTAKPQGVVA